MENTVKDRIREFIKFKNISVREFERICNFSNGYINGIRQTIMPNKMSAISLKFPDLNPGWLLTGEGEMLLDKKLERLNKYSQTATDDADLQSKVFTWIIFSMYEKQKGFKFSFDSFSELTKIFNLASIYTETLQNALEAELYIDTMNNIKGYPKFNDDGAYIIPESLTKEIDKYAEVYNVLKPITENLMKILHESPIQKDIIEYVKNKNTKE